jgi:hypothetical protein
MKLPIIKLKKFSRALEPKTLKKKILVDKDSNSNDQMYKLIVVSKYFNPQLVYTKSIENAKF